MKLRKVRPLLLYNAVESASEPAIAVPLWGSLGPGRVIRQWRPGGHRVVGYRAAMTGEEHLDLPDGFRQAWTVAELEEFGPILPIHPEDHDCEIKDAEGQHVPVKFIPILTLYASDPIHSEKAG